MSSVFSAHYFPSIQYMADFIKQESPLLDGFENMQKQSYRNRCYILGPNGKQMLSVPKERNLPNRKMMDTKISYAENWQKQHFKSLEAAYRSSPYFEFYEHIFTEILTAKPKYMFDLNLLILERLLTMLQVDLEFNTTKAYATDYNRDFRDLYNIKSDDYNTPEYVQVFEEKQEFIHNLSIIDLICNQGPQSNLYLKKLI